MNLRTSVAALTQKAAIAIVFSAPFLVDGFKYGAERGLPITAKERKQGVLADVPSAGIDAAPQASERCVGSSWCSPCWSSCGCSCRASSRPRESSVTRAAPSACV